MEPPTPAAPTPPPPAPASGGVKLPPLTLQQVLHSHLSGVLHYGMLSRFAQTSRSGASSSPGGGGPAASTGGPRPGMTSLAVDSSVLTSLDITGDSTQEVEPSVATITESGVDRTTAAYFRYDATDTPRIHYATTTTFALPFQSGMLPLPAGYTLTADPLMSENPYTGGHAPLRAYCVGIAYNNYSDPQGAPNAIALWHSDPADNGNWTARPAIVDQRAPGSFLDKPSIAVSWHNSYDLGYVYVAYTSFDYVHDNTAIVVATSTNGGASFTVHAPIAYGGGGYSDSAVQNTQVVVDPATGEVYVLWVDFGAGRVLMAKSPVGGASFGAHEIAGTGVHRTTPLHGQLRALTVPMARFNWVNGTVDLTWHADSANGTDIEYSYRSSSGWHQYAQPVVQFTANDHFMPALDFNGAGRVILTYYDRHEDPSNSKYRAYEKEIYYWGAPYDSTDRLMGGDYNLVPSPGTGGGAPFIGDYQDIWDWAFANGEKATASWIGIPGGNYNAFLSRLLY